MARTPPEQEINFTRQNGDEYNLPKAVPNSDVEAYQGMLLDL